MYLRKRPIPMRIITLIESNPLLAVIIVAVLIVVAVVTVAAMADS